MIVVGVTGRNRSWLTASGRSIFTGYDVTIDKGGLLSPILGYHGMFPIAGKGQVRSLAGESGRRVSSDIKGLDENGLVGRLRAIVARAR